MNYIFICPKIIMGGIETLMARMSKWLIDNGHEVSILCPSIDGEMYNSFDYQNIIYIIPNIHRWHFKRNKYINSMLQNVTSKPIDVIISFSPTSLKTAIAIASSLTYPCRIAAGVWGNTWFIGYRYGSLKDALIDPANYLFHKLLKSESRLYMNETVQNIIEESCGKKVPGIIWPLPVNVESYNSIKREPERGRIVSVGRLSGMKEYNIGMIDVIKKLTADGLNIRWDVYGDGKYRKVMEDKILFLNLKEIIQLHGNIDYNNLHKAFEKAWLFVGMGTAIVEAACAKIPSIAVVPFNEEPMTFGYFHELPEYNVGEMLSGCPKDFYEMIKSMLLTDDLNYNNMCTMSLERAKKFDLEKRMLEFLKHVDKIKAIYWPKKITKTYRVGLLLHPFWRRLRMPKTIK